MKSQQFLRKLNLLEIAGCIITIDAIGCQQSIAQTIIDKKADYILSLKANQGNLHRVVKQWERASC
jgi:predicted transposase YbfD/YdcC